MQNTDLPLNDPQMLETAYQQAKHANRTEPFQAEIARLYASSPDNLLIAAWYFRLRGASSEVARSIPWRIVIPFSFALSILYWLIAPQPGAPTEFPTIFLGWAPPTAVLLIALFVAMTRNVMPGETPITQSWAAQYAKPAAIIAGIIALDLFVLSIASPARMAYRTLMVLHLPLLSTLAVGLYVVGLRSEDRNYVAALLKIAEAILTAGIIAGAAMAFVAITMGLFLAIGIDFVEPVKRWLLLGVPGLVPLIAVALVYDPSLAPARQRFDQGFSRLIFTVARLFLPLTILVGAIYLLSIPANFFKPFQERDVLIVYNAMLFAVMALLAFATPLSENDVPERWRGLLRRTLIVIAAMVIVVSVYALSATVYRTALNGWTMNRLTIIGWNMLNIAILMLYLYRQFRANASNWIAATHRIFRIGLAGYGIWSLFIALAIPILFP